MELVPWQDASIYIDYGLPALLAIIFIVATLSSVVGCSFKCMLQACCRFCVGGLKGRVGREPLAIEPGLPPIIPPRTVGV